MIESVRQHFVTGNTEYFLKVILNKTEVRKNKSG